MPLNEKKIKSMKCPKECIEIRYMRNGWHYCPWCGSELKIVYVEE